VGYKKIQLCGERAKRDGLQYFWVDTCCINKANKAEHSLAIRSMFRWYRKAARCYVYLPDVTASHVEIEEDASPPAWDIEFRQSKWFTRGWTLQELLAPRLVEFFSCDWHKLGDRVSLKSQIHETTTIAYVVLEGASLSHSSANSTKDMQVVAVICEFIEKKYLYWLEALSLCKSMAKGVTSMTKLWLLIQVRVA
jgi:hypothetical protein